EAWASRRRVAATLLLALALVPLAFTTVSQATGGLRALEEVQAALVLPLRFPGIRQVEGLGGWRAYRERLPGASRVGLGGLRLPEPVGARIAASPVDVYPWEASYVPANGLSWRNRPVPSSFSAYTPALDAANARFFDSDGRPSFLLWHLQFGV